MKGLLLAVALTGLAIPPGSLDVRDFTGGVGQGAAAGGDMAVITAYPVQTGGLNGTPSSNNGVFGVRPPLGPYGPVRVGPRGRGR